MREKEILLKCLDKYHNNRAYQDKPSKCPPEYVPAATALEDYKFFLVGSKYFLPSLIIDIDKGSKKDILKKVEKFPLVPTFIVETDKGYHLWWLLKYPIKPGTSAHSLYKFTVNALVDIFAADSHAKMLNSGHIFRNPLKAKNYIFTDVEYTLSDFYKLFKHSGIVDKDIKDFQEEQKQNDYTGKYINLSKVKMGARNSSLTHNLGVYLRNRFKRTKDIDYDKTLAWALYQNKQFEEPLTEDEVQATVASMVNNFDENAKASEFRASFNRKLAKTQKHQTMQKAAKNLVKNFVTTIFLPYLMPHNMKKMSDRNFQTVAGIGKNTANRYKKDIKTLEALYLLIQAEIKELVNLLKSSKCCVDNTVQELKIIKSLCKEFELTLYTPTTSPP